MLRSSVIQSTLTGGSVIGGGAQLTWLASG